MLYVSRKRCARDCGSLACLWNRPRPSSSNLVALRSDMPASVAGTAHRRFTSWASRCTALAIGKATFGLDCVRKSHDCGVRMQDQMRRMRHLSIRDQADILNPMLRGHYAYYGIAGNIRALQRVHRVVERYWRIMLSSRSWKGEVLWKQFQQIKERFPLVRPKLYLPYSELQAIAVL